MADTYGAVALPAAATTPAGDPALQKIGDYLKAVVNAKLLSAWSAVRPRTAPADQLPIRNVVVTNPEEEGFNDKDLPALYIYREDGDFRQDAADIRDDESRIKLLWVMPSDKQAHQQLRKPIFNAVAKCIDDALERGRDPNWQDAGDTDPSATTIAADTDSIKLSAATQLGAQVLSGAALDGAKAALFPFSPRLAPTVTTAAVVGVDTYNVTDPIVWTVVDWYDRTKTLSKTLTLVRGGQTLTVPEDVKRVVSIALPGQLAAGGAIQFGTAAYIGLGSELLSRTSMSSLATGKWSRAKVQIEVLGEGDQVDRRLTYHALQMVLTVLEERVVDLSDTTRFHPTAAPGGADLETVKDGLLLAAREL